MKPDRFFSFFEKTSNNIWIIFSGTILSWVISMSADLSNVGLGGLAHLFFPWIIGIATLLIYLVLSIFTKRFIWIITIVGVSYNLILAYRLHFDLI